MLVEVGIGAAREVKADDSVLVVVLCCVTACEVRVAMLEFGAVGPNLVRTGKDQKRASGL